MINEIIYIFKLRAEVDGSYSTLLTRHRLTLNEDRILQILLSKKEFVLTYN